MLVPKNPVYLDDGGGLWLDQYTTLACENPTYEMLFGWWAMLFGE